MKSTVSEHYEQFPTRDWGLEVDPAKREPVRFALIGLGLFTRNSILPAIGRSALADATVLVSGSKDKAERVAEETGIDTGITYEQFHDGRAKDEYDAAFVCTPNALHLPYIETCADLGKAVLCEKPMAATVDGAREIVAVSEQAEIPIMIAYRLQTNPGVRWCRALVRDGYIGTPIHCRGSMSQRLFEVREPDRDQWRLQPDLSGGAAMIDLGIYPLNTARFVLNADPVTVQAFADSPDEVFDKVDEHISFEIRYDNDALLAGTASQNAYEAGHLHITGTKGEIILESAFMNPVIVRVDSDYGEERIPFDEVDEVYEEIEYFASCLLADQEPLPDAKHGLADMKAIEAIYRSAEYGGRQGL
ncbi:D-xylose 1-dehydrogenase Gfo6 [Halomontanus rarus]|uniref:D-xylose 1-dehydrogenase Gfo6 n=1 Tax=Halomontanus rarus TaxID=3034020 RepID=UPI00293BE125|nr:D-xylose 1-dehydrogenase Gfo6 [Halovivax sp. KZCA124]